MSIAGKIIMVLIVSKNPQTDNPGGRPWTPLKYGGQYLALWAKIPWETVRNMPELGRTVIVLGVILVAVGVILLVAPKIPWLGKLPGDFTYKSDRFTFYFPLATSILISVVLSLILYFFRK
jgi:hypothetical protein